MGYKLLYKYFISMYVFLIHLSCLFRMQKRIDLKQKQRNEQVQKLKEKLEKVKDHDLWTTIASKTFEVRIQYYA